MFRLDWIESAVNELADYWLNADQLTRDAITRATNQIDQHLRNDPLTHGESREAGRRIHFVDPLAVTFEVNTDVQVVTVLHIRVYRRREA